MKLLKACVNIKNVNKKKRGDIVKKANTELRAYAKAKKVPQWAIAEKMGITEIHLCRLLRHEFEPEKAAEFKKIVDKLAAEE